MKRLIKLTTFIMISLIFVLCIFSIIFQDEKLNAISKNNQIKIVGTYSIDNGKEKDMLESIDKNMKGHHKLVIKGHFEKEIEKNKLVILHLRHVHAVIKVNGNIVYEFGKKERIPIFMHTSGNVWGAFVSNGIKTDDNIEIQIENWYKISAGKSFYTFIEDFQYGYMYQLYEKALYKSRFIGLIGIIIAAMGIEGLIICVLSLKIEIIPTKHILAYSLYTFWGGMWIFYDSNAEYASVIIPYPTLNGIIDMMTLYFLPIMIIYLCYVNLKLEKGKRNLLFVLFIMIVISTVLMIIQLVGCGDLYETQSIGIFMNDFIIFGGIYYVLQELRETKDKNIIYMLMAFLPICISGIIESINFYVDLIPGRVLMRMGIIMSIFFQLYALIHYMKIMIEAKEKAKRLEQEIINMKIDIMLSQIQPHFLFNSLIAIKQLCDINPSKASQAVEHFSFFLRSNIDSLGSNKCIKFEKELNHVENYLYLEKIRFEDRLKIKFDINIEDFLIPPLTLQPIVENAVRYGVSKKREGGFVKITTLEDEYNIYVIVEDNGIGFDINNKVNNDRKHIGIENVKSRIHRQCNGKLIIESKKDKGTKVKIIIPKLT